MATFNFNTFSNNTVADANAVTTNFQNIKNFVESQTVQVDGSVKATTASIADDAITAAKIAANAVGTSEIANDAVTADKVADGATLPVNITGSAGGVDWANVSSKPSIGDVFNNGGTYGINISGSAALLNGYSSSISGDANTIPQIDGTGILAAFKFGMGVSNATYWVASTYSGSTIFRAHGNDGVYGNAVGTSGTRTVYITSTGTLGVASTSSRRFKENIKKYEDVTNRILNVSPVTFDYKVGVLGEDEFRLNQFGLIAEDMHDAGLTHLVEYDENGNPDGIKYERLSLELLNTVKNLNDKIERLEQAVESLKNV